MARNIVICFLLIFLSVTAVLAWQPGPDPAQARIYSASAPKTECANDFVKHLWGQKNGETFGSHAYPLNGPEAPPPAAGADPALGMARLIWIQCLQPANTGEGLDKLAGILQQPSVPIVIEATLFRQSEDDSKSYWKAADEIEVYRLVKENEAKVEDPTIKATTTKRRLIEDGFRVLQGERYGSARLKQWALHPALYGDSKVNFIGVSCLMASPGPERKGEVLLKDDPRLKIQYTVGTTSLVAENWAGVIGAIGTLFGASPAPQQGGAAPNDLRAAADKMSEILDSSSLSGLSVNDVKDLKDYVATMKSQVEAGRVAENAGEIASLTKKAEIAANDLHDRAAAVQPSGAPGLERLRELAQHAVKSASELSPSLAEAPACRIVFVTGIKAAPPFQINVKLDVKKTAAAADGGDAGDVQEEPAVEGPREESSAADLPTPQMRPAAAPATPNKSGDCGGFALGAGGCSSSHQVQSADKERWDVGMALPIPGVLERQYQPSKDGVSAPSLIHAARHAAAFAMFNLYPFSKWASKSSFIPGFAAGAPVVGKSFWMPFVGFSENLTGWRWLQAKKFPIPVNFLFGWVYLNQETLVTPSAAIANGIGHTRTWKPMMSIELPVKGLVSKLGALGGSSGGGKQTSK